jgi:hypothetical protein
VGRILRLRISLADRAGALAQAATVIGMHSGNILSIDVHRNSGPTAIDDLVVEFPEDMELDDLGLDLVHLNVHVLSAESTQAHDPVEELLRRLADWLDESDEDDAEATDAALIRAAIQLCPADNAWIASQEEAAGTAAGRAALDANHATLAEDGEDRVMAVPLAKQVLFLARSKTDEFTITEVSRIRALAALQSGRLGR